ncbi:MAG: MarR family transcriptional regulator [Steroidobacteraceae bacterium]
MANPIISAPRLRPPLSFCEQRRLWLGEAQLLIDDIRNTAAALDLTRSTLACREGRWGFAGGNPRRHALLLALKRRARCHSISDLARDLRCSRQAAHRLATALGKQGLVAIEPGPADKRPLYLELSSQGRRALECAEAAASPCLDAIGDTLTIREMRALGTALRGIRERAAALRATSRRVEASAPGCAGRAAAARSLRSARR